MQDSKLPEYNKLKNQINQTLCKDRYPLQQAFNKANRKNKKLDADFQHIETLITSSIQKSQKRRLSVPALHYPRLLPITEHKDAIVNAIKENQVVIITGETGSGKTTQLPKICLEAGRGVFGKIGCTQPRRIAATSLARQVADELKSSLGDIVGYKIRFDEKSSERSLIQFMTDGILLTEAQNNRFLNHYDTIIIDEAHERSLNIDFLLGYLKQILPKRPDLKLIVTSATIDVEKFAEAFPQYWNYKNQCNQLCSPAGLKRNSNHSEAPIIEVSGRMYPVEVRYHPIDESLEEKGEISISQLVQESVEEVLTETSSGDILVFLSGVQEIKEALDRIQFLSNEGFEILPLYGRLTGQEQNRIFRPGENRRIILSTNIAETSITIPRIRYVIDSGRARISQYNSRSGTQGLPVSRISQSSANQRKGRCGRISNGICIRLYTEEDFVSRSEYSTPEIQRSDLSEVILRMSYLGLGDIASFPFIDPPDSSQIRSGFRTLKELGALTTTKKLTSIGRRMAGLPVDPRTARMIIQANSEGSLYPVLVIAAGISCQDPREWPEDKRPQAEQKHARFNSKESDLLSLLNLWEIYHQTWDELKTQNKMRKFCKQNFLSYRRMREWRDIHTQLTRIVSELGWRLQDSESYDNGAIHRSILAGYLTNIAQKKEKKIYQGTKNRELLLFPGSGQYRSQHDWIVAVEIIETSRLFAHRVAKIEPDWLEPLGGLLCKKSWTLPRWDEKNSRVVASEKVTLFGFTIVEKRTVNYGRINPDESTEVFIREGLVDGKFKGNFRFWKHNCQLIESIKKEEEKTRKRNLLVNETEIERFYRERIKNVSCIQDMQQLINNNSGDAFLHMTKEHLLLKEMENTEPLFPDFLEIGGIKCKLDYTFNPENKQDGITLHLEESLLNNLRPEPFEYLVPGLLQEKILWLLKNLPKATRKKIVPVPQSANQVWEEMTSLRYSSHQQVDSDLATKDFYTELSETLFKLKQLYIEPEEWLSLPLPEFLKMNFKIVDLKTGKDRLSRNLFKLQGKDKKKNNDWKKLINPFEEYQITHWDFPNLIDEVVLSKKGAVGIWGYRTLEKDGNELKLTISKRKDEAIEKCIQSVPFLIEKQLGSELGWLFTELRFPEDVLMMMQQHWSSKSFSFSIESIRKKYGGSQNKVYAKFHEQVQTQVYEMAKEGLCGYQGTLVSTEKAFLKRVTNAQNEIKGLSKRIINWIGAVFRGYNSSASSLMLQKAKYAYPYWENLETELSIIMPANCLESVPLEQWCHLERILKCYQKRIEKYLIDPDKEEQKLALYIEHQQRFEEIDSIQKEISPMSKWALERYRWMVEEYKVSLFAQELKTAFPISPKRLNSFLKEHEQILMI
jgi:ATP-dependent helicase HrpA